MKRRERMRRMMNRCGTTRKEWIHRFFSSYLCVILPLTLILLFITTHNIYTIRENQEQILQEKMIIVREDVDALYLQNWRIAQSLLTNPQLSHKRMTADEIACQTGLNKLTDLKTYLPYLDTVFLSYGDGKIYSNTGMSREQVFYSALFNPSEVAYVKNIVDNSEDGLFCLTTKQGTTCIFVHIARTNYGSLNFVFYPDTLLRIMQKISPEFQNIAIEVCFSDGRLAVIDLEEEQMWIPEAADEKRIASQYQKSVVTDSIGMTINLCYEDSVLIHYVRKWQILLIAINCIGLLASIAVAYFMSRRHSKPLINLTSHLEKAAKEHFKESSEHKSPYDYMNSLIEKMSDSLNSLTGELSVSRQLFHHYAAALIFRGLERNPEDIRALCALANCEITEEYHCLCCISIFRGTPSEETRANWTGRLYVEICEDDVYKAVVLFKLSNSDEDRCIRTEIASRLAANNPNVPISICFSGVGSKLEDISNAYADLLIHMRTVENDFTGNVEFLSNFLDVETDNRLIEFKKVLNDGKLQDVLHFLNEIEQIAHTLTREATDHFRIGMMRTLIVMIFSRINVAEDDELLSDLLHANMLEDKAYFDTLRGMIYKVYHMPETNSKFKNALAYIDEHYSDPGLSLEMVANYSGFSSSHLSKLFRLNMNVRYLDYVTQYRMSKAKALLDNSTLSTAEIANQVGYADVAVFRRRFKEYFFVSTTQYRKNKEADSCNAEPDIPENEDKCIQVQPEVLGFQQNTT